MRFNARFVRAIPRRRSNDPLSDLGAISDLVVGDEEEDALFDVD